MQADAAISTAAMEGANNSPAAANDAERRHEQREAVGTDLWMVDHHGSTILKARCEEVSPGGMRLRLPLGYGVAAGQHYEMRTQAPGGRAAGRAGLSAARWATVVRTRVRVDGERDHLEVGVKLDPLDTSAIRITAASPGRV